MKILKLGQQIGGANSPSGAAWLPSDESSLEAWYSRNVGIALNGSDVEQWADSSSNSHDMVQGTATEQPAFSAGVLTFDSADTNNLQTTSQISLPDEFTIGFIANPTAYNNVILGDNTTSNEFFKYSATDRFLIKIDGSAKTFSLDSGSFEDDYLVVTRDASNRIRLWKNGVIQVDEENLSGVADIDAIGVRATDVNPFNGTIEEIEIFTTESDALTANINTYLSSL